MTGLAIVAAGAGADAAAAANARAAAVVIAALAALVFLGTVVGEDALSSSQAHTLRMTSALIGYFALWTAFVGDAASRAPVGIALFVSSIALFRLMRTFERPPDA